MPLDLSPARLSPYDHQRIGVEALTKLLDPSTGRYWPGCFLLADEMGAGKTKQVIDTAHVLFHRSLIHRVVVICPASVRSVWFDPELGELAKHLWSSVNSAVREFHARDRYWRHVPMPGGAVLEWLITNYEFIRSEDRLAELLPFASPKTFLVLDESSAVKSHKAAQTKACLTFRRACGRVVLLNGTPIANSPGDMFSQGQLMDPRILGLKTYFHFRAKYAVMGGWNQKQIIGWQNLEDLQVRFKPYVLRRLKKDCLDLPEALPPVTLTVVLTDTTWKVYKAMRDEMVAWLSQDTVAVVQQAAVKSLRLAQITSGFLGGLEAGEIDHEDAALLDSLNLGSSTAEVSRPSVHDAERIPRPEVQEIGREKLDFILQWFRERLEEDPNIKLLVWCRFRPELHRIQQEAIANFGTQAFIGVIHGGQKRAERDAALRLLDPRTAPPGPVFFGGTYGTGSLGLNFTACHTVVNLSYDYSYWKYLQSAARVDRPGQVHAVSYFDVIATGPKGQKTIDHAIVKARRAKEDVATWTTSAWIRALTEE